MKGTARHRMHVNHPVLYVHRNMGDRPGLRQTWVGKG